MFGGNLKAAASHLHEGFVWGPIYTENDWISCHTFKAYMKDFDAFIVCALGNLRRQSAFDEADVLDGLARTY
jgi:hypothetical protein